MATLRAEARHAASVAEAERDATEAREAHAATRLEAGREELDAAGRQPAELRTRFSTELKRAREQVTLAQERAEAIERRALRKLDAERTARQKSERTAEELRGELVAARSEARPKRRWRTSSDNAKSFYREFVRAIAMPRSTRARNGGETGVQAAQSSEAEGWHRAFIRTMQASRHGVV